MPCFNEAEGIGEFIVEIMETFKSYVPTLIVIDDCSTDETSLIVQKLKSRFPSVIYHRNESNIGHGPSTVSGLKLALTTNCELILSIDGDGQFLPNEILQIFDNNSVDSVELIEGVRTNRQDPWFRRTVTFLLRIFVLLKTKNYPLDANTPLRIYHKEILKSLINNVNLKSQTPNIQISIASRNMCLKIKEIEVTSIARRGSNKIGTTWKSKNSLLPSRRFISFCFSAICKLIRSPH